MAKRTDGEAVDRLVSRLDIEYQAAVKANDAEAMDRILHKDFILVSGSGKLTTRADLLGEARAQDVVYEQQDEVPGTQTVRVWGDDTAVVTALIWIKGHQGSRRFDYKLWFSDTYVKTPAGWKYAFAQVGNVVEKNGVAIKP
jgi:ketosteroid isomerase-like protein